MPRACTGLLQPGSLHRGAVDFLAWCPYFWLHAREQYLARVPLSLPHHRQALTVGRVSRVVLFMSSYLF